MKLPNIFSFLLNIFSSNRQDKPADRTGSGVQDSGVSGYQINDSVASADTAGVSNQTPAEPVTALPQRTNQVANLSGRTAVASTITAGPAATDSLGSSAEIAIAAGEVPASYGGFPAPDYGGFPAPDYSGFPSNYGGFPDPNYGGFPAPEPDGSPGTSYGGFPSPDYGGFPTSSYEGFPTSSDYSVTTTQATESSDGSMTVMQDAPKKPEPTTGWGGEAGTSPDPAAFVFESKGKVDTDPLTIKDGQKDHNS